VAKPPLTAKAPSMLGRRTVRILLGAAPVAAGVVLLNALAWFHAWRMLHFGGTRERTKPPERLTWYERAHVLVAGIDLPKPRNDQFPEGLTWPCATHRVPTTDHMELEAWWTAHPRPRGVVVLFHGYAATKSSMLGEARAFHALGFSTLLVDHRGHGGSSGHWTSIGYHEVADVAAAADYVRNHLCMLSPLVLYGQSMGAVSIFRAVSTAAVGEPAAVIVEGLYDEMLNAIRNRFDAMGVPSFPFAELLGFWGGVQMGFTARRHNPAAYARAIRTPVLMLHGSEDPRATCAQGRRVFEKLRGPKAFVEFRGLKHESLYTASPDEWVRAVDAFLETVVGPPGADARTPFAGGTRQ